MVNVQHHQVMDVFLCIIIIQISMQKIMNNTYQCIAVRIILLRNIEKQELENTIHFNIKKLLKIRNKELNGLIIFCIALCI